MPNPEEFSMPGPQFGNNLNGGWLKNNWRSAAAVIIVALLASGAAYFYNNYQQRVSLLEPALKDISASPTPTASASALDTGNSQAQITATPKTNRDGINIVVTAAKGNGTTHLARQALKEYLKDKPELAQKLTAEHRIYIEDFLRKQLTGQPKALRVGDQITFSDDALKTAVDAALALTDGQLNNLSKYVPLVPSLMTP